MAIHITGVPHTFLLITGIGEILTGVGKDGITILGIGVITVVIMDRELPLHLVVQPPGLQPLRQIRPFPDVPISTLFLLTNNVITMYVPHPRGIQEQQEIFRIIKPVHHVLMFSINNLPQDM
jgi:hypothetical protein